MSSVIRLSDGTIDYLEQWRNYRISKYEESGDIYLVDFFKNMSLTELVLHCASYVTRAEKQLDEMT